MKKITLLCIAVLMTVFTAIGQTIVLNEDFESAPYELSSSGTVSWGINSRLHASGSFSDSCTVGLSSTSYLTTNSFSTVGNTSVLLEFKHICKIESGDAGQVEYSIDGGTTWTLITNAYYLGTGSFTTNKFNEGSYVADWQFGVGTAVPQNSWWKTEQFDLGAILGNQANVKIRFKLSDPNNTGANQRYGWYIDDVKVTIAPSELVPPTITLVPTIYQDTVYGSGPFDIKAKISDISGIATATLFYSVNSGAYSSIAMSVISADTFHAAVPAQAYDTRIDYYITAVDASLAANTKTSDTTWFFVKEPSPVVIIGTGTSTTSYLPCYGYYNYGWSAQLYNSYEINSSGMIDTLCFFVGNTPSAGYTMTNQRLMLAEVSDTIFSTTAMPDSASMSTYFASDVVWTGPGWYKFIPLNPFYYSGTGSLLAYWINRDGSYSSGYPNFQYTNTTTANKAKYTYSDTYSNVFPTSSGTLVTTRPNIRIVFNNNTNDVAMTQMTEPVSTPVPTVGPTYNSKIIFTNLGSDNLTSLTINWSIDGVLQSPYAWTGSLAQSQSSGEITLGTLVFASAGFHTIKAWSSLPNGIADESPVNDTISKTLYVCQTNMAGTYTIDPLTPTGGTNFQYFADAMGSLMNCGISDTTIINIATGTYDTTLTFNGAIPGAGPSACVIFQSASGVNTDVVLRDSAIAATSNYIVKLNGTSRVQFRNMSFLTQGATYGTAINIGGGSHYNLFEGNIIGGQTTTSTSSDKALIYNSSAVNDTNNIVRNNILNNGSYGIYWYGVSSSSLEKNSIIEGNTLNNFYFYGIYSNYQDGIVIRGNMISTNTAYTSTIGMYLYYSDYSIIEKNEVVVPTYYGIYLYECDADSTTRSLIANNMIQVGGTSTSYGLYTSYCDYANVYHNTVNSNSSSGRSLYIYYGGNLKIKNNFITNTGGGFAIYNYSSSTVFESDYNNLYTTGAVLGYNGANTGDIAAWRTSTGKDSHSVSITPAYYGPSDLHTMAFATNGLATPLGITEDIDGEPRNMTTPDMGADEFDTPPYEAGLLEIVAPSSSCGLGVVDVVISIKNNGSDTINGGFSAGYQVNSNPVVSENISTVILPGDTLEYTFAATTDMSALTQDSTFLLSAWITLAGDTIQLNDTLETSVTSGFTPPAPTGINDTVPYATSASLSANSPYHLVWYDVPTGGTLLDTGIVFNTPVLYDTTTYYVGAVAASNALDTLSTSYTGGNGCSGGSMFNVTALTGGITIKAFNINTDLTTSVSVNVYYKAGTYLGSETSSAAWTLLGTYTATGQGTNVPTTLAVDDIVIPAGQTYGIYLNFDANYTSASNTYTDGTIEISVGAGLCGLFSSVNAGRDFNGAVIYTGGNGCESARVPVTAVITGIPANDLGVISIDDPDSGIELTNNEPVSVRIVNFGTAAASNFNISYQINSLTPVTEVFTNTILPGDTAVYNFTNEANLVAYATYSIKAYPGLTGDIYNTNDTAYKTVTNASLTYCVSAATSTGDEDILNVTIGSLNNTSPSPHTVMYTDYTSVTPPNLSHGQTYPMSVTETDDAASYWSGYIEAYIDFNHDGIYQEPEEVVLGGAYTSANQTNTITSNVTIPLTAYTGTTGMRVIVRESGTAATVTPCGTYSWGETEDYLVVLAPQIPFDAGVISIDEPGFIQSEDSQVPVVVTVRNYGTNTLTSIPVEYVVNGGTPVAYTWTGSLAPNATTQVTMPDVTVLPDSNEICAYTLLVNDTNTFNDDACAYFYGLPPAIIFEDDMENGTQLFTDAPTLWEHGVPTANVINTPHSPDSVWTTNLDGDYPNSASGFVYTPNMNFFGVNGAYLTFYYWIDAEENNDGGYIQYSTNNGSTWSSLGTIDDPAGFNWFDSYASGTPAWTKATNGWKPAFIKLDAVSGYSIVKFRFGFKSNTSTTNDGFAIDDIKILGPAVAIDGGVVEIVAPATATATGAATTVTVKIKNFGTDTLTSIPVSYRLDTGFPPQNGTWTGTLLPDSTVDYTFTQTYPGPSVDYELCAYTKITGDPYKGNDTTCVLFDNVIGMDEESVNSVSLLQNIPNPASAQTEISFTLPAPGKCVLTLRNTLGELVQTTTIDGQSGKNSVNVDLSNLGQGIYMYTLEYKDVVLTRRLSVIK